MPHSSSDDQRKYRTEKSLEEDLKRDPIILFKQFCIDKKIFTETNSNKIENKIKEQISKDTEWADKQGHPPKELPLNMCIVKIKLN